MGRGLEWGRRRAHKGSAWAVLGIPEEKAEEAPRVGVTARVDVEASRDSPWAGRGALSKVRLSAGDRMELRGLE